MTDAKLLPCPFCGSTNVGPEGWATWKPDGWKTGPACYECNGSTESVERWNTRTAAPAAQAGEVVAWESAVRLLQRCRQYIRDSASDSDSDFIINDREHLLRALASICGEVAPPPPRVPSVEEIARAFDPDAFVEYDAGRNPEASTTPAVSRILLQFGQPKADAAIAKAQFVAALFRAPAPVPAAEKGQR